jgi:hypothetical protein
MIDELDNRLKAWVYASIGTVEVSLAAPEVAPSGCGVGLYLMELIQSAPGRGLKRPPLQIVLRYLVTVWAEKQEEAHRLLGELTFAALDSSEFEVEADPVPIALWTAFGVPPRPSFVLRAPLRRERPERAAPRVLQAVLGISPMRELHGLVVGPNGTAVAGAQVEFSTLKLRTRTDTKGRFHFPCVPAGPGAKRLRVRAKGHEVAVTTAQTLDDDEPLIVRFNKLEK